MTVWVVRAGKDGSREEKALDEGFCFIGWPEISEDLSHIKSKEQIRKKLDEVNADRKPGTNSNHASQIWSFINSIKKGDIIGIPLKNRPAIAFGEISSDYFYKADNPQDMRHCRKVKWLNEPILRSRLDSDLNFSFGAVQTVFSVRRNKAEERIRKILTHPMSQDAGKASENEIDDASLNLLDAAAQQISDFIGRKFKGRKMEVLVEAILKAQGYETNLCPEGADNGIDILAGTGTMGFASPRLCVQVKSSDSPESRETLDKLQGNIQKFKADYGLLVSWGGFKSTVIDEARRNFFQIRLWNDQRLVKEIQAVYEKLPPEIQTELPLQRTWVLVEED